MKPGIRARLTLWYAAVLLFILACLSAGVFVFVRASMEHTLTKQLDRDIDTVATVVAASPKGKGRNGHLPGDVLFAVTKDQRLIYHSDAWCRTKCLHGAEIEPVDHAGVWRSETGTDFRIKTAALWINGQDLRVAVAEDMTFVKSTMNSLLAVLLLSFPCAALLSIGGGYWLAGRALRPISAMAAKAHEITAESLSERLPVGNPNDELGRMATVFNETLARLEAAFERLRAFVANASHELRTPLTAIRSVGEVALRKPLDAESARDVIGSMLEEVSRLTRMVEYLLDLARAEPGAVRLPREDVDLAEMAASTAEMVRVLAEEKGQEVLVEVRAPAKVRGDLSTLRQALTNLLDNAIRYTPAHGRIRVLVGHGTGGQSLVEVEDNGPGIAPEERGRVFDRFYRAQNGAGATEGTGLGLAIARSAVEANGGRLEYESAASGGSRFRMIFCG